MDSRFAWIMDGHACGPDPRSDIPLLSTKYGVIIPSIGALVPGWLLVVPRVRALSYAELKPQMRESLYALAQNVGKSSLQNEAVAFLEHGASTHNSVVGCGVDQAHLHVVPLHFSLIDQVHADKAVSWEEADPLDPWRFIASEQEYYLIVQGNRAFTGSPLYSESQYFRKHIARGLGLTEQWDYKGWPHYGNVARTIRQFEPSVGN